MQRNARCKRKYYVCNKSAPDANTKCPMDNYINATRNTAEIVMCENEYYIRYLESEDK